MSLPETIALVFAAISAVDSLRNLLRGVRRSRRKRGRERERQSEATSANKGQGAGNQSSMPNSREQYSVCFVSNRTDGKPTTAYAVIGVRR